MKVSLWKPHVRSLGCLTHFASERKPFSIFISPEQSAHFDIPITHGGSHGEHMSLAHEYHMSFHMNFVHTWVSYTGLVHMNLV